MIPVTVDNPGTVVMWWDDPWISGAADTNLDFFLIDANDAIVTQGIDQNIGSASPQEFETAAQAGSYRLAIRVTDGPDPSRVCFQHFSASLTVDQSFGDADLTFYPTTFGHRTVTEAIGVGSVLGHVETHLHVRHGAEVIDLVGLNLLDDADKVRRIGEVTVMKFEPDVLLMRVLVQMVYTLCIDRTTAALDAVNIIVF